MTETPDTPHWAGARIDPASLPPDSDPDRPMPLAAAQTIQVLADVLTGFDPADSSTWHPMHAAITSPMHRVARMLGVRLGTNMGPAIEYLARALFPPVAEDEVQRLCRLLDTATELKDRYGDDLTATRAEIERLRGLLAEVLNEVERCYATAPRPLEDVERWRREAGLT